MEQGQKRERPGGGDRPASSTGEWRLADQHPTLQRMEFSMTVAAPARLTPPALSTDHLMDTPLPQLLAELRVELVDSQITDLAFFGALVERRDGSRVLSMPPGRSAFERDTAARMLLAEGLGLDAPPVPAPLKVSRA